MMLSGRKWVSWNAAILGVCLTLESSSLVAQSIAPIEKNKIRNVVAEPTVDPDAIPADYDSLVKLKSDLIAQFRDAEQRNNTPGGNKVLEHLFKVELALLELMELELDSSNLELLHSYRQIPLDDGMMLAGRLVEASRFQDALSVYESAVEVANRLEDYPAAEFNELLWLRNRAERLTQASSENQQAFQSAIQNVVNAKRLMNDEKFVEAAELFGTALPIVEQIGGPTPLLGTQYEDHATCLLKSKRVTDAEKSFKKALAMLSATLGQETPRFATTLYNLGIAYRDAERFDDAAQAFALTSMIEQRVGVEASSRMMTLNELAGIYRKLGDDKRFDSVVFEYRLLEHKSSFGLERLIEAMPVDAYAAATIDPAAIYENESLDVLPRELMSAWSKQFTGIDPADVQTILAFVTLPIDPDQAHVGFLIKPIVGATLQPEFPGQYESVNENGLTIYKSTNAGPPSVSYVTLDDGVLLVGTSAAVQQSIAAQRASEQPEAVTPQSRSKVAAQLMQSHGQGQLRFALDVGKIQMLAQEVLKLVPPLPPEVEPLRGLPSHVDLVHLGIALDAPPYLSLAMVPRPDSSTETIQQMLQTAMQAGFDQGTAMLMDTIPNADSELAEAMVKYLQRVLQSNYQSLQPVIQDGEVKISVDSTISMQVPVFVALMLPAVEAARGAAQTQSKANQLRQIGLAMHNFHAVHGKFPARQFVTPSGRVGLSWRVQILPYVEEQALYDQFHLDEPWDSPHNKTLIDKMPAMYADDQLQLPPGHTTFLTLKGIGTGMESETPLRMADFTDGTSNTAWVVQADADQAVIWTKPDDLAFDPNNPRQGLGGAEDGTFAMLLVDGAVKRIDQGVSNQTLNAYASRNGGEVIEH